MKKLLFITLFLALFASHNLLGQVISPVQIDSLVERVLRTFDVPGIAVGIIKDDKLILAKGYGVRCNVFGHDAHCADHAVVA